MTILNEKGPALLPKQIVLSYLFCVNMVTTFTNTTNSHTEHLGSGGVIPLGSDREHTGYARYTNSIGLRATL